MRAVIDRAPLLGAMGRLMGVVERRQVIPILANVYLTLSAGRLTLRATDLDMEIIEAVPASVDEPGEITVSAEKLHDIARNADAGCQITIATKKGDPRVQVQSGRSRFNLPAIGPEDFPKFAAEGLGEPWTIKAQTLADMVNRVSFARGDMNPMTNFSGVFLTVSEGQVHAVACHKAGVAIRREPAPDGAAIASILTPKFTGQLVRWLSAVEGDAMVSASASLVRIEAEGAVLIGKVIDGQYFDYGRLLSEQHEVYARTDQDALSGALKRVMIMGDNATGTVQLTFADDGISLSARNDQSGDGADEIGCEYAGPEAKMLMNAARLQDAIASLSGDQIELGFASVVDPKVNETGKVIIRTAPVGTGIIAGGPMRAVFEALGIQDVVAKSVGTSNPHNMLKATFDALHTMKSPRAVAAKRGKSVGEVVERREGKAADATKSKE